MRLHYFLLQQTCKIEEWVLELAMPDRDVATSSSVQYQPRAITTTLGIVKPPQQRIISKPWANNRWPSLACVRLIPFSFLLEMTMMVVEEGSRYKRWSCGARRLIVGWSSIWLMHYRVIFLVCWRLGCSATILGKCFAWFGKDDCENRQISSQLAIGSV